MKHLSVSIYRMLLLYIKLLLILSSTLISSCDSSTSQVKGSLTGYVQLINDTSNQDFDPADNSGVSVSLYQLVSLDSIIVSVINTYPGIGLPISQYTEFDHRLNTPIYHTMTDAIGGFKIENITPAKYNIVITKEGWGTIYILNYDVSEGVNQMNNSKYAYDEICNTSASVALFPTRYLSGTTQSDIEFLRNHSYEVVDNSHIVGNVIIENGAQIMVGGGKTLNITGNITTYLDGSGKYSKISSRDVTGKGVSNFSEVIINGNVELDKCIVEHSSSGIRIIGGVSYIKDSLVRNGLSGFIWTNSKQVKVENCIAFNISDSYPGIYTNAGGFYVIGSNSINMHKLVLVKNGSGIKVKDFCFGEISNSYFADNTWGVESYSSEIQIHNNLFERSDRYDIRVCGHQLQSSIDYNQLDSDRGVIIGLDTNQNYINCAPHINFNNIASTAIAIHIIGYNSLDPDATNNYYYSTETQTISNLIIDGNDYDPSDPSNMVLPSTGIIDYTPFLQNRINSAGIHQ